ncbi:phage tail tape measure protein [Azorhizobium doebereinerae]|uniref:phage tail tape measure protein n=1 Tax=Azorhizobium doebereinerae TaxID=281091 RepID=UPI0003F70D13|nr:phage tail tape measure protein [Azorhizobium doebereinerae]
MSNSLDVSILVRLVDRVTAPLKALQGQFSSLAAFSQKVGALGLAVAAIDFAGPVQSAAAFDQVLRDSAVTAGLFGQAAETRIAELGKSYQDLALKTGIASLDIAKAAGSLIAAGMDEKQVDALLPALMRVSKASNTVPADVAKVAFALNNSLQISSADMELAMAKLVAAGKLGGFGFKDMARELPELSAQFGKFGMKGMEAVETIGASLQVAMFGTDSTSTAASNFKNFLSTLLSPETIKNFGNMGVDITGVMKDAAAKGLNPVETAIEQVAKLTGVSDKQMLSFYNSHKAAGKSDAEAAKAAAEQIKKIGGAEKLGKVFGDTQVLDFLLPMLANIEKYKEFKKEIAGSGLDVITKDFNTQMAGLSTQIFLFTEIATQFGTRIGLAFAKNLPWINKGLMAVLGWTVEVDKAFPGLIDNVLMIGGGFLVLVAALGLLGPVFTIISGGFGVLTAVVGVLATVVGALFTSISFLAAGLAGVLLTPIGLLAAALAGIAVIIINDWANFAPLFRAVGTAIVSTFGAAVRVVKALFSGDWSGLKGAFADMVSGLGSIGSGILAILQRIGAIIIGWLDQQLGTDIRAWPGKVAGALSGTADTVVSALQAVWSGAGAVLKFVWDTNVTQIKAVFTAFSSWVDGWSNGAFSAALAKVGEAWTGLKNEATKAFAEIKNLWQSVVDYINAHIPKLPSWSDVPKFFNGDGSPPAPGAASGMPETDALGNPTGGGFSPGSGYAPLPGKQSTLQNEPVTGHIIVSATEGARITNVQSDNPLVALVTDRGTTLGRA